MARGYLSFREMASLGGLTRRQFTAAIRSTEYADRATSLLPDV